MSSDLHPASTRPVRLTDGPVTYIVTYIRDLDHQIVIDKIFRFDDLGHSNYGETVKFSDLPDYIKLRYWGLVR